MTKSTIVISRLERNVYIIRLQNHDHIKLNNYAMQPSMHKTTISIASLQQLLEMKLDTNKNFKSNGDPHFNPSFLFLLLRLLLCFFPPHRWKIQQEESPTGAVEVACDRKHTQSDHGRLRPPPRVASTRPQARSLDAPPARSSLRRHHFLSRRGQRSHENSRPQLRLSPLALRS